MVLNTTYFSKSEDPRCPMYFICDLAPDSLSTLVLGIVEEGKKKEKEEGEIYEEGVAVGGCL